MTPINSRINFIVQTLARLFDVESAPDCATEYFKKNNVSHAKLMRIIEYWIDQSKPIFGEPVVIQKTQSLRDAGVDLIVEFISSKVKIGFQIKSYGDVKEKNFHKNVNAQISDSQRYELQKLIIVIAGNLNDEKVQGQKIRGLIAELEQRTDDYISIIPPERTLPMCQAHETKQHPLNLVMLDFQDAFKIAEGLSKSLSSKKRKVNIEIKVNYPDVPKLHRNIQYTLKLKPGELDIFDRLENLSITGDVLKFSKEQFSKFTVDGIDQLKKGFQRLEIQSSEDYDKLTLNVLDDREITIIELDELTFGKRIVGDGAYVTLRDKKQKSLLIELYLVKDKIQVSFGMNYYDVDLSQIRQAIEFMKALEEGKWIQILIPDHNVDSKFPIPKNTAFSGIDGFTIQLVDALLIIEERSGIKLRIPEKISDKMINQIVKLAKRVVEETFPLILSSVHLSRNDGKHFINLFKNSNRHGEFAITFSINILDKKIPVTLTCLINDYDLKESIQYNMQNIAEDNGPIEIKLRSLKENSLVRLTILNKN